MVKNKERGVKSFAELSERTLREIHKADPIEPLSAGLVRRVALSNGRCSPAAIHRHPAKRIEGGNS